MDRLPRGPTLRVGDTAGPRYGQEKAQRPHAAGRGLSVHERGTLLRLLPEGKAKDQWECRR